MFNKWLYPLSLVLCAVLFCMGAQAQRKTVAELTLVYDYSAGAADAGASGSGAAGSGAAAGTANAVHTIYIKGNMSRSEMTNSLFSSTTIFDGNTGFGVILKEVSGQKLLIQIGRAHV